MVSKDGDVACVADILASEKLTNVIDKKFNLFT